MKFPCCFHLFSYFQALHLFRLHPGQFPAGKKSMVPVNSVCFYFLLLYYCFGYAHEINQHTLNGIYDSLRIQFIGIPFSAVLFLMFSIKLVTGKKLNYYLNIFLLIIPVITVFIVFNIEKHDLFYIAASVKNDGIFPVLIYQSGPWYIVNMANLLLSSAAAEIILAVSFFRRTGNRKQQILFVFFFRSFSICFSTCESCPGP